MRTVLHLVFALIGFGCAGPSPETREMEKIELGGIKSSPQQEKIVLEDLNASIETICLATNDSCLLSKITQLVDIDFLWIVADRQIYKFDKSGAFIQRIGQKGQGPAEYVAPERIQVDSEGKIVYVIDYFGRKMMAFDYVGNLLRSLPLPEDYSLNRIALDKGQLYYSSFTNSVTPDLLACDLKTGEIDTISFRDRTMGQEAFAGETFIYKLKGDTYLYHYFNDTVYTFTNNQLTPAFLFDLGNSMFTYKQLTIIGENTSEEPLDEPKVQIINFIDTEKYLFVPYSVVTSWQFTKEQDNRFAFYDKDKKAMYPDVYLVCKEEPLFSIEAKDQIFASSDEHSIYTLKQASDLVDKHVIKGLEAEGNPVIIKYKFQ